MGNCHTETIARYLIDGQYYFVTVNWQGKTLADDPARFYDIFDGHGTCLNEGEPWYVRNDTALVSDAVAFFV